jgi:molybdopterin-guanine dinucleotide biosynthesis protein A
MGSNKACLRLGGVTLLERAVATAREAGFTVSVCLGTADLPADLRLPVPTVTDRLPDQGPLGGISAALDSLSAEPDQPVLFLPVDVPLLPAVFLRWLWNRADGSGASATIPRSAGRDQPLCAVYTTRLAAPIRCALAAGERKVIRAITQGMPENQPGWQLDQFDIDQFDMEEVAPLISRHLSHLWFTNVNTPQDWAALQQQTLRGETGPNRIYKGTEAQ